MPPNVICTSGANLAQVQDRLDPGGTAANRCPEDWDRKPISNSFLTSPHGKHSYFTKCFGNFAPGWKVLLAEWGSAQAYSLNALNVGHCQGPGTAAQPSASPTFLKQAPGMLVGRGSL